MPLPLLAAGGLAALFTTVLRYVFLAHLGSIVLRLFAVLGLSWITNEMIVENILDMIHGNVAGVPSQLASWMSFFGFDKVISIVASAYTLVGVKRVFLGKAS
jgi:hypothetical protein